MAKILMIYLDLEPKELNSLGVSPLEARYRAAGEFLKDDNCKYEL